MVASWPRSRSRDSNSPGPENVPVVDHLFRVVTDCASACKLATRANERLAIDSTLGRVAAMVT
jgi:hypothetical protein